MPARLGANAWNNNSSGSPEATGEPNHGTVLPPQFALLVGFCETTANPLAPFHGFEPVLTHLRVMKNVWLGFSAFGTSCETNCESNPLAGAITRMESAF